MANSAIPLQVGTIKIPDPIEGYGRALSLKQLLGQQQLQQMQLAQAQRAADKQARFQQFGKQSGGDLISLRDLLLNAGDIEEGLSLDTALTNRTKAQREAQSAALKMTKDQWELTGQLAGAVVNSNPQDRPVIWSQALQLARQHGLPDAANLPDQWDERLLPQIQSLLMRSLSAKDALERGDYAALGGPQTAQPVPQSGPQIQTIPQDMVEGVPLEPGQEPDFTQTGPNAITTQPHVVTAKSPKITPDGLREQARQERLKKTKIAFEYAKELEAEANRLDDRIFKEREQWQPVGNAPGVTFNKATNEYLMDGKPISAKEVQKIAARQSKAGATNVNVNSMNPADAAKTELLNQGIADMAEFKELIMPGGKVNREIIAGMSVPGMAGVPGTDSRIAYSLVYNAVEAKLRAESGAAVPETEVQRMAARFIPSPLDSDEAITSKVRRLEAFLRGSFGRIKGAGEPSTPKQPTPKKEAKKGAGSGTREDPYRIKGDDGYDMLKRGEFFMGPDGVMRQKP